MRYTKRIALLKEITQEYLLRKTKETTIASMLPPCNIKNIDMVMIPNGEQQRVYEKQLDDDILLRRILRMRQSLNNHTHLSDDKTYEKATKILAVEEIIAERPSDDKIIIFSYFTSMLFDLYQNITIPDSVLREKYIQIYHGEMDTKSRNKTLATFKNSTDAHILLINLRAGGCGLNLTEANHVIIIEPYWNESEQQQALNRVYRLGQTKEVFIYRLHMINSIEKWLVSLQGVKNTISKMLIDKKNITVDEIITQKEHVKKVFQDVANN
jgi:SNF2 family DNA or RNA helicase